MDREGFYLYLLQQGLEKGTIADHSSRINVLLNFAPQITEENFKSFLIYLLKQGRSKSCLNKYIQLIKHYCKFTKQTWGENFTQYREKKKVKDSLSEEEIEKYLELPFPEGKGKHHQKYIRWTFFWALCAFSACRLGEIRTLTVEQIDMGRKMFVCGTKTEPRLVPINEQLMPAIENYLQQVKGDYLFPSEEDPSQPLCEGAYRKDYMQRLERLGIKRKVKPSAFRHSAIHRWLRKLKMNVFDVQQIVGHRSPVTTLQYYDVGNVEELKDEIDLDPIGNKKITPYKKVEQAAKFIQSLKLDPNIFSFSYTDTSIEVKIKENALLDKEEIAALPVYYPKE